MNFKKLIWKIGAYRRNPSLYKIYYELKKSENLQLEKLENIQLTKAIDLIKKANINSKYYNDLFKKHAFNPDSDFNSLSDLYKIPITSKNDLIANATIIQIKPAKTK